MKIKPFKIRCSALSQIMTEPRSKSETLSQTAKSYCESWLLDEIYNRKTIITSKYFEKGIKCEDAGIQRLSNYLNVELKKNEIKFENDFMTGTPDIKSKSIVYDIKNSYSHSTFPILEDLCTKENFWQMQGYMILTGTETSYIVKTLEDMPEEMILKESYRLGISYQDAFDMFTYFDVHDKLRIKLFEIQRENVSEQIRNRVAECQQYINKLIIKYL
jgi:hypothetical protein